jgi:hypothetical protein
MGKRSSRRITTRPRKPDGITTRPTSPAPLRLPGPGEPGRGRWWGLLLVVAVAGGAIGLAGWYGSRRADGGRRAVLREGDWDERGTPGRGPGDFWERVGRVAAREGEGRQKWVPPEWKPESREDRVVDRFVRLRKAGAPAALALLGRRPVFTDRPMRPAEAEALDADYFLRDGGLKVTAIWWGEPDGTGGQKPAAGRYTLATRGAASTPPHRTAPGAPEQQRHVFNPELVVEVRDGKVFGVRVESVR